MPEYKVGDRVRIIANTYHHGFRIGEIVRLVKSDIPGQGANWCGNRVGSPRYLLECDFELVERAVLTDGKIQCCNCGECFDECYDHDGEWYCEDCESECFVCCEHCSGFVDRDGALGISGNYYCNAICANNDSWYCCENCQEWHNADDLDEDGYCAGCRQEHDNGLIKEYDWQPREFVFDKMPWENTIYLGIELEVECPSSSRERSAEKVMAWLEKHNVQDRVYIKEDGSLRNGFELVFMPSTLQAIHKRFPMREFLGYLNKIGLKCENNCGLHVHISRKKLTARDLWAGKLFFYKCQGHLLRFSCRNGTGYCKFDTAIPVNGMKQENGRYSAFNTSATTNTVEIRVFSGTLEYERFLASLQMSDLFAEYIQQASVTYLKRDNGFGCWANFLGYAKKSRKYGQFLAYCNKKGIV